MRLLSSGPVDYPTSVSTCGPVAQAAIGRNTLVAGPMGNR